MQQEVRVLTSPCCKRYEYSRRQTHTNAAMESRSQLLARRKRRRRRRADRPPVSAHLLLDERMEHGVGIVSDDLLRELFPHYGRGTTIFDMCLAWSVADRMNSPCGRRSIHEYHTPPCHCSMAAGICSLFAKHFLDHPPSTRCSKP